MDRPIDLDRKPGYEIYESVCREGNYGPAGMLSAAREEEKASGR